jgi:hypothetical protein
MNDGYQHNAGQKILANTVIPAGMPVSSAMDGNLPITLPHDLGLMPNHSSHPCDWIPASLPE